MKIEKNFEKLLTDLEKKSSTYVRDITGFIRRHKRLLVTAFVIYMVFNYLFDEGTEDNE